MTPFVVLSARRLLSFTPETSVSESGQNGGWYLAGVFDHSCNRRAKGQVILALKSYFYRRRCGSFSTVRKTPCEATCAASDRVSCNSWFTCSRHLFVTDTAPPSPPRPSGPRTKYVEALPVLIAEWVWTGGSNLSGTRDIFTTGVILWKVREWGVNLCVTVVWLDF